MYIKLDNIYLVDFLPRIIHKRTVLSTATKNVLLEHTSEPVLSCFSLKEVEINTFFFSQRVFFYPHISDTFAKVQSR